MKVAAQALKAVHAGEIILMATWLIVQDSLNLI